MVSSDPLQHLISAVRASVARPVETESMLCNELAFSSSQLYAIKLLSLLAYVLPGLVDDDSLFEWNVMIMM